MPDDIEFLPQHDIDDEPAEPARRTRGARLRWIALAVAAVLGLGIWVATRPSDPAGPAAAPASVPPAPATGILPSPSGAPVQQHLTSCTSDAPVDTAIVRALRVNLPGVRIDALAQLKCVRGVRDDAQTVSERAVGNYRGLHAVVDVYARGHDRPDYSGPGYPVTGPDGTVFILGVDTESAGLDVHVSVFGPSGSRAPMVRIQHLADDLSLNLIL